MTYRASLAGVLAAELAAELTAPMQGLRDRLALLVDHIDRYISHSTGPTPYPWQALQGLRHDLGGAYLEATLLVRQLGDVQAVLAPASGTGEGRAGPVDGAHQIEVALNLLAMKHTHVELIADVGATPPVHAEAGALALVLTRLLWLCAQSVDGVAGSAISLRSWLEPGSAGGAEGGSGVEGGDAGGGEGGSGVEGVDAGGGVVIAIADNGHGLSMGEAEMSALFALIENVVAGWRGSLGVSVAPGRGCSFELHLAVAE